MSELRQDPESQTPQQQQHDQDQKWMQVAIDLARRGQYSTKPNPNVGCVIVKDDVLLGEGFHPQAPGS